MIAATAGRSLYRAGVTQSTAAALRGGAACGVVRTQCRRGGAAARVPLRYERDPVHIGVHVEAPAELPGAAAAGAAAGSGGPQVAVT